MSAEPHRKVRLEDYLAAERRSETRSEYLNGEVLAMTGASRRHNLIVWSLAGALYSQLRGRGCEAYVADMRVFIPAVGLYTYPDIAVACGEPRFEDSELDTLLNPTLIIEVLSATTEGYDRGRKSSYYRSLDSLQEYVLVSQEEVRVELYTCQEDGHWLLSEADRLEASVDLVSIGCTLRLAEVYERVFRPGGAEEAARHASGIP